MPDDTKQDGGFSDWSVDIWRVAPNYISVKGRAPMVRGALDMARTKLQNLLDELDADAEARDEEVPK